MTHNTNGFRIASVAGLLLAGAVRLCAQGIGLLPTESSESRPDEWVDITAGAVIGQQLKRDVVPMQPRVITIYYGWNDHWCAFGMEDKQIGRFYHAAAFTQLFSRSRVAQLIAKACFATPSEKMMPRKRVAIEDFRANLRAMVRIAKDHSIIPVLLTAPSAHQAGAEPPYLVKRQLTDLSELIPLHESYVQAVRDVAAEERVPMVDLYQLFRGLSREECGGLCPQPLRKRANRV